MSSGTIEDKLTNQPQDASRILVVEDNPEFLAQAQRVYGQRDNSVKAIDFSYVGTLNEALEQLDRRPYDGVITDLFYPLSAGWAPVANGTVLGEKLLQRGIPFVIVTSTYHHGNETEPSNLWARSHGMELIDNQAKSDQKNFEGALFQLGGIIEARKLGKDFWNDESFGETPYFANNMYYYAANPERLVEEQRDQISGESRTIPSRLKAADDLLGGNLFPYVSGLSLPGIK